MRCPSIVRLTPPHTGKGVLSTTLMAEDAAQKLVGTWCFSGTNALENHATQTMATETKYRADGTFSIKGEIGMIYPANGNSRSFVVRDGVRVSQEESFSRIISGVGIWRIDQGHLCMTITNSSSIHTNVENRYEIVSLTEQHFIYRNTYGHKVAPADAPKLTALHKP